MSLVSTLVRRAEALVAATPLRRLPQGLLRFLAVGVGGLLIDISILTLLEQVGLHKAWARAVSIGVATLFTWTLNRYFTFGESGRDKHQELGRYALVAALAQSINYLSFLGISDLVPRMPHALAAFLGAVLATGFSYTGQRFFTFAPESEARRASRRADA
jgi:putative flippase GtrA